MQRQGPYQLRQLPDYRHLLDRKKVNMEASAFMHGFSFSGCLGELSASRPEEVVPALKLLEQRVAAGLHAVGFLSYAAASALNGDLGVGSGITFDPVAGSEYAESLSKARFAREKGREFHLIESLLFDEDDGGYFLLERHLERLSRSARYFGFALDPAAAREALHAMAKVCTGKGKEKVRLLLFRDGRLSCESAPIKESAQGARAVFAQITVDSSDLFLYHKTSWRAVYQEELARHPENTDVIFLNERGEVTEGSSSNVVALLDGELMTPPLASGLLPGVFRAELLALGSVKERTLTRSDLESAEQIYLINSVRKWRSVKLVLSRD
jgi:para-aminobenzoate synthetase / 4-amino-4-deoxychorismate lyase